MSRIIRGAHWRPGLAPCWRRLSRHACWRCAKVDLAPAPASPFQGHHDAARQEGHGRRSRRSSSASSRKSRSSRCGSCATTGASTTSRPIRSATGRAISGPRSRYGDRQAPEGFYTITREQMNPDSKYHLALNLGYPNAYDKAQQRTGDFLMIHGKCKSAGCYAMTDALIEEIYAIAREVLHRRQRQLPGARLSVPHDATENMARHAKPRGVSVLADPEGGLRLLRGDAAGCRPWRSATGATSSTSRMHRRRSRPARSARRPARRSQAQARPVQSRSPASSSRSSASSCPDPRCAAWPASSDGTQRPA